MNDKQDIRDIFSPSTSAKREREKKETSVIFKLPGLFLNFGHQFLQNWEDRWRDLTVSPDSLQHDL